MNTKLRSALWLVVLATVTTSGCRPNTSKPIAPSPAPAQPTATATASESEFVPTEPSPAPKAPEKAAAVAQTEPAMAVKATNEPGSSAQAVVDSPAVPADMAMKDGPTAMPAPPESQTEMASMAKSASKPATWTTERIVIMGRGGPRFIKLDVNVGNEDLETGFRSALASIANELQIDFETPTDWNSLLDKPIIAAGWLGNLVPNNEQRDQLRGLYDKNTNGKVDEPEFQAFLTRGLSRNAHLKLSSRPSTAPRLPTNSVWGPIDLDESGDLSAEELGQTSKTLLRFDFDGDNTVTPSELSSAVDSDANMTSAARASLLDLRPVHAWEQHKADNMVRSVFDHYSFGEALTGEMLSAWPARRWQRLDANADKTIEPKELRSSSDEDLDGLFQISLPNLTQAKSDSLKVNFQSIDPVNQRGWLGHPTGGRLTLDGCIVTIVLNDEQGDDVRQLFRMQFGRIEKDAQLQAFAMQALELKPGAMETLQSKSASQEMEAVDLAWHWLVTPRHFHVQIGWSASDSPWFELIDSNGDQKLVLTELDQFAVQASHWDRDKDGVIQLEEMPVSVLLEIKRTEARGLRSRLGGTTVEKRGANAASAPTWFTGMDYNSDGELSLSEFLGDQSDFEKFDQDRNGIIEAREVTTPQ